MNKTMTYTISALAADGLFLAIALYIVATSFSVG